VTVGVKREPPVAALLVLPLLPLSLGGGRGLSDSSCCFIKPKPSPARPVRPVENRLAPPPPVVLPAPLTEDADEAVDREENEDIVDEVDILSGSAGAVAVDAEVTDESPDVSDLRLEAREEGTPPPFKDERPIEGAAWVKSESSVLGSSTDQSTSKTVDKYECSDWGSSADFGRGRGAAAARAVSDGVAPLVEVPVLLPVLSLLLLLLQLSLF